MCDVRLFLESLEHRCVDCFVSETTACHLTCICANAITNFVCGANGCNPSGKERSLKLVSRSDYHTLEIAWFDPWTYLALILFLIIIALGTWRMCRSSPTKSVRRVQSPNELDKIITFQCE